MYICKHGVQRGRGVEDALSLRIYIYSWGLTGGSRVWDLGLHECIDGYGDHAVRVTFMTEWYPCGLSCRGHATRSAKDRLCTANG